MLKVIAESICSAIDQSKHLLPAREEIAFVRAGQHLKPRPEAQAGLHGSAHDWHMRVDLETRLKFPETIVETTLQPDIVLVSETSKQVVMLELTVP